MSKDEENICEICKPGTQAHKERIKKEYDKWMGFIEFMLPNYHSSDLVLETDLLWRYVLGEELPSEDLESLQKEYPAKTDAVRRLIEAEAALTKAALTAFYRMYFCNELKTKH